MPARDRVPDRELLDAELARRDQPLAHPFGPLNALGAHEPRAAMPAAPAAAAPMNFRRLSVCSCSSASSLLRLSRGGRQGAALVRGALRCTGRHGDSLAAELDPVQVEEVVPRSARDGRNTR